MARQIDNKTRGRAIGFLVWFRNKYKYFTSDTYMKIAKKYGQCNYGTVRNLMLELEEAGYIRIWQKGSHNQRFYLDLQKYNELVYPHIFVKNDPRIETPETRHYN